MSWSFFTLERKMAYQEEAVGIIANSGGNDHYPFG
jgi:hypothetical protein